MFDVILPPVFGTVLCAGLLFLLSKKNNWKWILIAFGIYYAAMFAFFGDYTGLGSFSINALAYFICLPIFFIPFILHAVFKKFDSFLFTFIFPVGIVLTEYIGTLFVISPGMNIGYRFFHIKPMIQCASFIGAAGLSFILGWLLSAVVTMISRKFKKEYVITAIVSAAVVLAALTFGFIRLGNVQEPTQFVHASWATGPELSLTDGVWSKLSYERNMESFEKTSKEAYENNAELLIYAEEAFAINENKLEEFLNVAKGKAKEYNMAMLITFDIEYSGGENHENCLFYIERKGESTTKYIKHMVIPIVEAGYVRGKDSLSDLEDGFDCGTVHFTTAICYDGNFENYIRSMPDEAEIYLYPSWDWAAIENNHTMIAGFRAVENGITLVKSTCYGKSVMFDEYGHIIFNTHTNDGFEKVYSVDIPLSDKVTFYEKFGTAENVILVIFAIALFTYATVTIIKKNRKQNDI